MATPKIRSNAAITTTVTNLFTTITERPPGSFPCGLSF
jgi:hypothetical protein